LLFWLRAGTRPQLWHQLEWSSRWRWNKDNVVIDRIIVDRILPRRVLIFFIRVRAQNHATFVEGDDISCRFIELPVALECPGDVVWLSARAMAVSEFVLTGMESLANGAMKST